MRNKLWLKILIGVVALGVVAAVAVPFIYINFIKDDAPETVEDQGLPSRDADSATTVVAADSAPTTAAERIARKETPCPTP